ncbi:fungal-specific transcription factor domain-containing protein [Jackrogersella minutella]|nr:fungal-specific transcription factor domain-containing protein [Jackrogersella minutella]
MVAPKAPPKACHHCRRRRLRCDRSVPECHKCTSAGIQCPGYGKFYKWVDTYAATQVPATKATPDHPVPNTRRSLTSQSDIEDCAELILAPGAVKLWSLTPNFPLVDPLFQDLELPSRHYLNYYAVRFCQDLIIYDSPQRGVNPFRDLVPMSQEYPFLREIIIAASALHFCNAMRWHESPMPASDALVDALRARHRAVKSLQTAIERQRDPNNAEVDDREKDALLAAVLFFVNFALIDSGKSDWRSHMNFVGKLLSMRKSQNSQPRNLSELTQELQPDSKSLFHLSMFEPFIPFPFACHSASSSQPLSARDYIASDSMAYYIWSNALDSLVSSKSKTALDHLTFDGEDADIIHILLRTEANSYHSCPSRLLYAVFRTSQLAREIRSSGAGALDNKQIQSCLEILQEVQAFDGDAWAENICANIAAVVGYLDEVELEYRRHISATFRAAVCLYVLLVAPGLPSQLIHHASLCGIDEDDLPILPNTAELTSTILYHLSFIPTDSPLFKSATWPVFLTGIETANPAHRIWVLDRLREYRNICPWGMITSTMETLVEIWRMRDSAIVEGLEIDENALSGELVTTSHGRDINKWLMQLQCIKIDCLMV